jgi:hypothetical protein
MSDGQKRAWFDELKLEFPNLPEDFVRMSVEVFANDPALLHDMYKTERKRMSRATPKAGDTRRPGSLTFEQLEERSAQFERQRAEIERDSKAYVVADPDLPQIKLEDSEKTVEVC